MDFKTRISEHEQRVSDDYDKIGGKALLVPGSASVSGARKILASVQRDATLCIMNPEVPIVQTGYENRFGDYSSSLVFADTDYQVVAKISKYSFSPNHHYWLICKDLHSNRIVSFERISAHHVTEQYGYLYNNTYIDSINPNDIISKNKRIKSSLAYDEFNNRMDGVNLNILYMALDENMEDSIVISDVAADKLKAPLVKEVDIMINENDIPLNYYGNNNVYKCMPDIGERTKDAILVALRKENKDNAIYAQSVERLKYIDMTDDKYLLNGTVIDVEMMVNNPENLEVHYNAQFKMYYMEQKRCAQEIISTLTPLVASGCELSDDLAELYAKSKLVVNGNKYIDKREFSNMKIRLTVIEERELQVGDKISNRYGGKGVVSVIVPQQLMPRTEDGEYADILMNSSTMYNRENPAQLIEMSITRIGELILKYIKQNIASGSSLSVDDAIEMIGTYLDDINKISGQGQKFREWASGYDEEDKKFLIESMCNDKYMISTVETMKSVLTIDDLDKLYKDFPFVKQTKVEVPIQDSSGNIRYIPARRKVVMGKEYILRLKQYALEKFSATSLSATNIRNNNTKSKSAREYKTLYSHTPIRMGDMEITDMLHLGPEVVIEMLLLHSVSPHARKLVQEFSTGNPYLTDIKLDDMSTNRSAEIVETYLKAIGLRMKFIKTLKKKIHPIHFHPLMFNQLSKINPLLPVGDVSKMSEKQLRAHEKKIIERNKDMLKRAKEGKLKDPLTFYDNPQ